MADDDIRVQLTRIEGMLGVTNERLSNVQTDIADVRRVQHSHGDRLGILEADKNRRDGERKGLTLSSKMAWSALSLVAGGGGVFAVLEVMK